MVNWCVKRTPSRGRYVQEFIAVDIAEGQIGMLSAACKRRGEGRENECCHIVLYRWVGLGQNQMLYINISLTVFTMGYINPSANTQAKTFESRFHMAYMRIAAKTTQVGVRVSEPCCRLEVPHSPATTKYIVIVQPSLNRHTTLQLYGVCRQY